MAPAQNHLPGMLPSAGRRRMFHGASAGGAPALIVAAAVAAAVVFALLLAFAGVMRGAVEQGDSRRRATAQHWESVWRCNALPGRDQQQACIAQHSLSVPGASGVALGP